MTITTHNPGYVLCITSDDGFNADYKEFFTEFEAEEAAKDAVHEYNSEVVLYEVRETTRYK